MLWFHDMDTFRALTGRPPAETDKRHHHRPRRRVDVRRRSA